MNKLAALLKDRRLLAKITSGTKQDRIRLHAKSPKDALAANHIVDMHSDMERAVAKKQTVKGRFGYTDGSLAFVRATPGKGIRSRVYSPEKKAHIKLADKVEKVMREYKHDTLHSGSKHGPKVKSRKQAIAIALSEKRKAGEKVPEKKASDNRYLNKLAQLTQEYNEVIKDENKAMASAPKVNEKFFTRMKLRGC